MHLGNSFTFPELLCQVISCQLTPLLLHHPIKRLQSASQSSNQHLHISVLQQQEQRAALWTTGHLRSVWNLSVHSHKKLLQIKAASGNLDTAAQSCSRAERSCGCIPVADCMSPFMLLRLWTLPAVTRSGDDKTTRRSSLCHCSHPQTFNQTCYMTLTQCDELWPEHPDSHKNG